MNRRCFYACCTVPALLLTLMLSNTVYAEFEGIRITTHAADQWMPAVSGDRIVWQDTRNVPTLGDIYLYDIGTMTERALCTAVRVQMNPAIDGPRIVWQDDRWGSGFLYRHDIYMYDMLTSVESPVTTATGFQMYPAISGSRIVWHDTRGTTPPNIYLYDLATGIETCLWGDPGSQYSPDISGSRVVCLDDRTGYRNVRLFDLSTQTETAITDVASAKEHVAICGDLIVWDDMRNGQWDIYLYNIATAQEIRITSDPGDQKAPRVSSEAIVWEDYRNDAQGDIYLYDLASGRTVPLVTGASRQFQPDIDGHRVVWTDDRHGNMDIFYLDYTPPTGSDVEVTVTDMQDPVLQGDVIVYHIRVRNNGPEDANGIVLVDWLDENLEYISAYSSRGLCHYTLLDERPVVICPMGDLKEGWYGDVTVLARATRTGKFPNRAEADIASEDYFPANNTAEIHTTTVAFLKKGLGTGWLPRVKTNSFGAAHLCFIRDGLPGIEYDDWPYAAPIVHCWDDVIYATNQSGQWRQEIAFDGIGHPNPPGVVNPYYHYEQPLRADLAMDRDGHVHLAYIVDDVELNILGQPYNNSLRLEYRSNQSGAWSSPQEVAQVQIVNNGEPVNVGSGLWSHDIEVDASGKAHMIYMQCDGPASQGYLVYCTNRFGSWQQHVLPAKGYDCVAMALDADGWAHVAYYTWDLIEGRPVDYQGIAYLTNSPDGIWKTPEAVESLWSGGQMEGMRCDIEVDSQNRPHISYVSGQGQSRQDYRHAVRTEQGWQHSLIQYGEFATEGAMLAIGPQDIPAVCFDSVYVRQQPSGWQAEEVGNQVQDIAIDSAGGVHMVYSTAYDGASARVYYYSQRGTDSDHDGIADGFEAGPNGNDPLYDGNHDGIPDTQQDSVASFPTHNDYAYITVACPEEYVLFNVGYQENPSPPDVPADWNFVFDFIRLMVVNLPIGGSTTLTLWLPEGTEPQAYYKYGPTPAMPTPHWYSFMYDDNDGTGAVIEGNRITLHLVDGQRGDNDLLCNGVIMDPGAPALYQPCIVDLKDLVAFLDEWMMQPPTPELRCDFDADGSVGLSDFIEFSRYWLQPCPPAWPF